MFSEMLGNVTQGRGLFHGKRAADVGKLVVRLAMAAVFINHGWPKLANLGQTVSFFGKIGIPAPGFFGPFVGVVEVLGGVMLAVGLLSSFWGVALAIDMVVAIISTKLSGSMPFSFNKMELDLMMLVTSLLMAIEGAGVYAIDALRRAKKPVPVAPPVV